MFTPAIEAPSDVEAFPTVVLTAVMFVFAVLIFVLAVASEAPSDIEARSVCALTAVVPAEILAAKEDEAFNTFVLVVVTFVPMVASVAPSELLAFVTSD